MATTHRNTKLHEFDLILVGSELSNLIIAHQLHHQNWGRIAIIDEFETLGGRFRKITNLENEMFVDLNFIKDSESTMSLVQWIQSKLSFDVNALSQDRPPVAIESEQVKPFVGFGEVEFSSIDQLNVYNHSQQIEVEPLPRQWIQKISESLTSVEVLKSSELTHINIVDNKIDEIIVNGSKRYKAKNYVMSEPVQNLLNLLPIEIPSPSRRTKISKSQLWTEISLQYLHGEILSDQNGIHFLTGTKRDFEPTLGRFFNDQDRQASVWTSLVAPEFSEDNERISDQIRQMKRHIKKAYPQFFDQVTSEKIVIYPETHGHTQFKTGTLGVLPEIENLFLSHRSLSEQVGVCGQIEMARGFFDWMATWQESSLSEELMSPPKSAPDETSEVVENTI